MLLLETQNLSIGYGRQRRWQAPLAVGLQLQLAAGQLVCLLGANGAGKSTLIRTLAGLQVPLGGQVMLGGSAVSELGPQALARLRSVVLTKAMPAQHLRVHELVALGRYAHTPWWGSLMATDKQAVDAAMHSAGCTAFAEQALGQLSDGQRQRAYIARALAQDAPLMLLDEPTAHLDLPARIEFFGLLRQLARQGKSILLSTHELQLSLQVADALWLLQDGRVHNGVPEDLVLGGQLQQLFAHTGLVFNAHTAQFDLPQQPGPVVQLAADEGLPRQWVQHALQRAGYVVGAMSAWQVQLTNPNSPRWQLAHQGTMLASGNDIASLLTALQQQLR